MMIRKIPCIPSKAVTITFPEGFLRNAFIILLTNLETAWTSFVERAIRLFYTLLPTQRQGLALGAGVSVGATCGPGDRADCSCGTSSGGNFSGCLSFHLRQMATMTCWSTPATGIARN